MKKKKIIATTIACGLIAAMALGTSIAYLTDNESHTNTVQVSGDVRIDLVEPMWSEADSDNNGIPDYAEEAVPNQEIAKNPYIINTGKNDVIGFIRLTVPVRDVTRVNDDGYILRRDGTQPENDEMVVHAPQDLFWFKQGAPATTNGSVGNAHGFTTDAGTGVTTGPQGTSNNAQNGVVNDPSGSNSNIDGPDALNTSTDGGAFNVHENTWGANWVRLPDEEFNVQRKAITSGSDMNKDGAYTHSGETLTAESLREGQEIGQAVYVFGYTKKIPGDYAQTTELFQKIQIKNIIENEIDSADLLNIKIEAFAIQADNLVHNNTKENGEYVSVNKTDGDNTKINTSGTLTYDQLEEIYETFIHQNGVIQGQPEAGAPTGTNGHQGDMSWTEWQDAEHGQVEKEADINNERDLHNTDNTDNLATTFKDGDCGVTSVTRINETFINEINTNLPDNAKLTMNDLLVGDKGTIKFTLSRLRGTATGNEKKFKITSTNANSVSIGTPTTADDNMSVTIPFEALKKGDCTIVCEIDEVRYAVQLNVMDDSRENVENWDTDVDYNDNAIGIPNHSSETQQGQNGNTANPVTPQQQTQPQP